MATEADKSALPPPDQVADEVESDTLNIRDGVDGDRPPIQAAPMPWGDGQDSEVSTVADYISFRIVGEADGMKQKLSELDRGDLSVAVRIRDYSGPLAGDS